MLGCSEACAARPPWEAPDLPFLEVAQCKSRESLSLIPSLFLKSASPSPWASPPTSCPLPAEYLLFKLPNLNCCTQIISGVLDLFHSPIFRITPISAVLKSSSVSSVNNPNDLDVTSLGLAVTQLLEKASWS